jgi:hypothetical protein
LIQRDRSRPINSDNRTQFYNRVCLFCWFSQSFPGTPLPSAATESPLASAIPFSTSSYTGRLVSTVQFLGLGIIVLSCFGITQRPRWQSGPRLRQLGQKGLPLKNECLLFGTSGPVLRLQELERQYKVFHENNAIILSRYDAVCWRDKCWYPGAACSVSSTNRFA